MAGPLIELLKGCFMSNSHQLTSYNYWVMDKTKGAQGNLHNKREAAKSSFRGTLTAKSGRFCVAECGLVCSWLRKANLPLHAAAHRESFIYLPKRKKEKTSRTIWKEAHNSLSLPAMLMTSSKQTWQKIG